MLPNVPTMNQLQIVISQAAAPAFVLGAVASFLSVLLSHMNRVIDHARTINDLPNDDPRKAHLNDDLFQLRRRAVVLHRAIYWAIGSGIVTCLLMIVAFASAWLGFRHEPGAAFLFVLSLSLFTASLFAFAREIGIALKRAKAD